MFALFKPGPLMDEDATQWMFDVFAWALHNFDADLFYAHTVLVLPSNRFFPGRADNTPAMAQLIFDRVAQYAAVSHWPAQVTDQNACAIDEAPILSVSGALRGVDLEPDHAAMSQPLLFPYNAQQISNPEAMIATFAHSVAHYLGQMAQTPPPGGGEYWPHITEVLATYLGFGLMFANSAYNFRGGCGSCYNPNAQRNAYLTEQQATYALALFGVLKDLPTGDVLPHLKSHLRGFYKKAQREINRRADDLAQLPRDRLQA